MDFPDLFYYWNLARRYGSGIRFGAALFFGGLVLSAIRRHQGIVAEGRCETVE
jgi:predicted CDP-diglyceride synthetase/phosphatidate cytidylyltransferase